MKDKMTRPAGKPGLQVVSRIFKRMEHTGGAAR